MSALRKRRPSSGLVVATIALIVAMTGTAYAGLSIPKNSVGNKQLKNGAVTSAKIKKGAVTAKQVNMNKLGTVNAAKYADTAGAATNATNGEPTAFASVTAGGVLNTSFSKNVGSVTHPSAGVYCFSGLPFTPRGGQATVAYGGSTNQTAQFGLTNSASGCPSGTQAFVYTQNPDGGGTSSSANFWVVFYQ